jgi:hypothetical protein
MPLQEPRPAEAVLGLAKLDGYKPTLFMNYQLTQPPWLAAVPYQVARCRSVEPALSPQPLLLPSTHAQQSQPGDTQASSTARHPHRHHGSGATGNNVYEALSAQLRRPKVTSEWMVLDLLEGRTTMLPCL